MGFFFDLPPLEVQGLSSQMQCSCLFYYDGSDGPYPGELAQYMYSFTLCGYKVVLIELDQNEGWKQTDEKF